MAATVIPVVAVRFPWNATVCASVVSVIVTVAALTASLNVAPPDCVIVNADKGVVAPMLLPKVITPPVPEFNVKLWMFAVAPLTAPLTVILAPAATAPPFVVSMVVRLPDVDPFSVTGVAFNVTPATPDV